MKKQKQVIRGRDQVIASYLKEGADHLINNDDAKAITFADRVLTMVSDHEKAVYIKGLALFKLGKHKEAINYLKMATLKDPTNPTIQFQYAQALYAGGLHIFALPEFDKAQLMGFQGDALAMMRYDTAAHANLRDCDWMNYDRQYRLIRQAVMSLGFWASGEQILASPYFTSAVQYQAAINGRMASIPQLQGVQQVFKYDLSGDKIVLGFMGDDFNAQATSYLIADFIGKLDRNKFTVIAIDTGKYRQNDPMRGIVLSAFDEVIDISDADDASAAAVINNRNVAILFSMKNPANARLGILARKPAPINVNYLYYPGTYGFEFMDYIVADKTVIPEDFLSSYSERVVQMNCCYQPSTPRPEAQLTELSDWGLPDGAAVMGNFSQTYKFTADMFDLWCRLLRFDDKRVLWLMVDDEGTRQRIKDEVKARSVSVDRIFFCNKADIQTHLNRLRRCDVVLDTSPYNGHTLNNDALWAGTPFVTLIGDTFASRVGASLLMEANMQELIALTEQQYIDIVNQLLLDSGMMDYYRTHLADREFKLFDMDHYASCFEEIVLEMLETSGYKLSDAFNQKFIEPLPFSPEKVETYAFDNLVDVSTGQAPMGLTVLDDNGERRVATRQEILAAIEMGTITKELARTCGFDPDKDPEVAEILMGLKNNLPGAVMKAMQYLRISPNQEIAGALSSLKHMDVVRHADVETEVEPKVQEAIDEILGFAGVIAKLKNGEEGAIEFAKAFLEGRGIDVVIDPNDPSSADTLTMMIRSRIRASQPGAPIMDAQSVEELADIVRETPAQQVPEPVVPSMDFEGDELNRLEVPAGESVKFVNSTLTGSFGNVIDQNRADMSAAATALLKEGDTTGDLRHVSSLDEVGEIARNEADNTLRLLNSDHPELGYIDDAAVAQLREEQQNEA